MVLKCCITCVSLHTTDNISLEISWYVKLLTYILHIFLHKCPACGKTITNLCVTKLDQYHLSSVSNYCSRFKVSGFILIQRLNLPIDVLWWWVIKKVQTQHPKENYTFKGPCSWECLALRQSLFTKVYPSSSCVYQAATPKKDMQVGWHSNFR